VQEPGVIERCLQYQRLVAWDRGAAAMQRACRKLRAGGDVSFVTEGCLGRKWPARRAAAATAAAAAAVFVVEAIGAEILPARRNVDRREHLPKPRRKILPVVAPHRLVGDAVGDFADARFER